MYSKTLRKLWAPIGLFVMLASLVASCAAPAPEVVEVTRIVTEKEEVEVPVEVVVTAAPPPAGPAVYRTAAGWTKPPAYHGSAYAPGGVGGAWWWVFEPLFVFVPPTKEVIPRLGASFEETQEALTVKLQPGAKWHDGTPVTSKDVWSTFQLRYLQNATIWKYLDEIEMPDDQTAVFKWAEPTPLSKPLIAGEIINAPYHLYGKWADQVDTTVPSDEEPNKSVLEDLTTFKPEFPIGTGPFKMAVVTASEMIFDKFADHYAADNVHFDKLVVLHWPNNEVIWAYLMAGEVYRAHSAAGKDAADAIMGRQPQMKLALPTDLAQFGIGFNLRIEPFSDVEFRKAIAHAIDRVQLREITYYYAGTVDKYAHNVLTSMEDVWLSKEFLDGLTVYDYDPDKAAAMLEDLGYTRGGDGNWLNPAGEPLSWEINCPAGYSDWVLACDNLATQLTEFGVPSECLPLENAIFWPQMTAGEYEVAMLWSAVWWGYAHPWRGFNRIFLGDTGKRLGVPAEMIGPDGETVNLEELAVAIGSSFDEDEVKALVEKAAWIVNENMLQLPYCEKKLMDFHNYAYVDGWPDLDDPIWTLAAGGAERFDVTMMVLGQLKPAQ